MVRARSRRVGRSGRRAQGDSRSDGTGLRRIHPLRTGRSAAEIWREREVPQGRQSPHPGRCRFGLPAREHRTAADHRARCHPDQPQTGAARRRPVRRTLVGTGGAAAGGTTDHHPRAMGCQRIRPLPTGLQQRCARGRGPPHRRKQQLFAVRFRGDHPGDLRVSHQNAQVVRHRLQRPGRQVRTDLRGPFRRHHQQRARGAHRRIQRAQLGHRTDRRLHPR
ncbi:Uncharacterised protein [Mycobacteroides abscessus subsp. abscessus]|nr:Uncharacterised protein [Mycobacteroides abscessus subsp. abscessus]